MSEPHDRPDRPGRSTGRVDPLRREAAAPSPAAARRLAEAVSERTDAYRLRAGVELTLIDALLRMGAPEAASSALEDCSRVLEAYARDIESAVAGAAAEREAEHVIGSIAQAAELDTARQVLDGGLHSGTAALDRPEGPLGPADLEAGAPERSTFRPVRRLIGSTVGVAAIALLLVVPGWRAAVPDAQLSAAELGVQRDLVEARYRMAALAEEAAAPRTITTEARALHGKILALPDRTLEREQVRHELRLLLDAERRALEDIADHAPEAHGLINEIVAIRRGLDLDEPGLDAPVIDVPPEVESPEELLAPDLERPGVGEEPIRASEPSRLEGDGGLPPAPPADDRTPSSPGPRASVPPEMGIDDEADDLGDMSAGRWEVP